MVERLSEGWPARCEADVYQGEAHSCDDPAGCAVDRLGEEENPTALAARVAEELLERVRALVDEARPSRLRDALRTVLS